MVAAELERRWEQALQAVHQEEERASIASVTVEPLAADLRRRWDEVRPSLHQMWGSGKLSNVHKKELPRVLSDKVVLKRPAADKCEVRIIWKGGNWSTAEFLLPVVTYAEMSNCKQLVSEVLKRARTGQRDNQIAEEMTAVGYHAPLKRCLSVDSVVRIRQQHGVYSRKTEFFPQGLARWISLGQAVERLGEHKAWAYYLIRKKRLLIDRDSEIGLYLVRDNKRVLKDLKHLLHGERFSLTLEPRSS